MQSIRQIQELNKRELEAGVSPEASWHADYRDTAYIYIGGLPFELSEGDVVTIFSQYGEPTYVNLIRDKETGKSKGFAFLKYEDQRSTDLAIDNLGGTVIMGRTLKVDHTRYKKKDGEAEEGHDLTPRPLEEEDRESRRKRQRTDESETEEGRPMLKEECELAKLIQDHDDEDPMKLYLVQTKKEEVTMALANLKGGKKSERSQSRHHHHRSRRPKEEDGKESVSRRSHHRSEHRERRRSCSKDRNQKGLDDFRTERSGTSGNRDEHERSRYRKDSPKREGRDRGGRAKSREHSRGRKGFVGFRRHPSRRHS